MSGAAGDEYPHLRFPPGFPSIDTMMAFRRTVGPDLSLWPAIPYEKYHGYICIWMPYIEASSGFPTVSALKEER
jgi:hypothetical protein